jgi:hypothetical protein
VLPLHEPPEDEGGRRSPSTPAQLTQPLLGDDRVLVLADHILEALRPIDEPSCRLAARTLCELGGVAGALSLDPDTVELVVARLGREPARSSSQPAELASRKLVEADVEGDYVRRTGGALDGREQLQVALARERLEERGTGLPAFGFERGDGAAERTPVVRREILRLLPDVLDEDVEIAHRPEHAPEPLELGAKRLRPVAHQHRACGAEQSPKPARGHPVLVEVLRVVAEPGSGVVREQLLVKPLQPRLEVLDRRGVPADGGERLRIQTERPEHLRARVAATRAGLPQRLLDLL